MDKAPTTYINSSVRRSVALNKKNQVTRASAGAGYGLAPVLQQGYGPWRSDAGPRSIDMSDQPTAIESTVGRISTVAIRRADKAECINGDVIRLPLLQSR